MRYRINIALFVAMMAVASCGGGSQGIPLGNSAPVTTDGNGVAHGAPIQYATEFPDSLPHDALQPWEELGSDGKVISVTGASSEFLEGPQTHFESGDISEYNGALRIASGDLGTGNLSYAMESNDPNKSTVFDYNDDDQLIQITYPQGRWLGYTYNAAGQRKTMTNQLG